jgi:hypothetical protein
VNRSRLAVAGIAVAAFGLFGCTSNPSTKAVAKDMVQSITVPGGSRLPQAQQDCMLDVIDKMSDDELKKLGADNENATFTSDGGGNAAMQAFIDELQGCPSDGSASTSTTTAEGGSTPDEGTTAETTAVTTTTLG